MSPAKRFFIALTAATLVYGGQIRMFTSAGNRYMQQWERNDGLAILAGILALALLAFVVDAVLRKLHIALLQRAFQHLLPLVLGAGLINVACKYADYKTEVLFLLLALVLGYSWARPKSPVIRASTGLALILSPLPFLMGWQMLNYPQWKTPAETFPEIKKVAQADATPVYIFIYDEWSWQRSTTNGEFLPLFKNVRALQDQSVSFSEARSAGKSTDISLPRFIFQTDADTLPGNGVMFWKTADGKKATTESASIFSAARTNGYNTYVRGFYLPYRTLLGDQVDFTATANLTPSPANWGGRIWRGLLGNLETGTDPLSRKLLDRYKHSPALRARNSRYWYDFNREIQEATLADLARTPANSLHLFHLPLPHFPYIFNADGTYAGPYPQEHNPFDVDGYVRQLGHLDTVIGSFVDKLKAAGKFDSALIVMTSDHSWRKDCLEDGKMNDTDDIRHVPLLIKLPGQKEPVRMTQKIHTTHLQPLFTAVLQGEKDPAKLQAILAAQAD